MLHHHLQGESRFIFSTSFHSSHISFEAVTTFQLSVHPFHPRLLFSVVRARSAVRAVSSPLLLLSVLSSSHWPSQGSTSWTWEGFRAFLKKISLCFFTRLLASLWMNRCEDHGPSRGSSGKQNLFTPNAKRKESGREGWMNGWMEAGVWWCIWCEALQRRVRESKPTTTWCHVPRQPQGIRPSACFWKTPSSCCFISSHVFFSFSQFFFPFSFLHAQPKKL